MDKTWTIEPIAPEEFAVWLVGVGITPPIEQSPVWMEFDAAVPGREHLGFWRASCGDEAVAAFALTRVHGRVAPYFWLRHGPVWIVGEPSAEREWVLARRQLRH